MKQVQLVSPDFIHSIWDTVEPFFKDSLEASNSDYNVDQMKMLLVNGKHHLLVAVQNDIISGIMTAEFINYPNNRVMHISALGGNAIVNKETFDQVEVWAKSQGATKIRAFAKDVQARLYKIKVELNTVTHVVEKNI